ncbi:MAG: methyltransferase domain-containing protein [Alphaproteobacteria bacterium]|nr:methyltransferase domain-containing protein [Rhodospirillaceae bacterium]MBT7647124.1 methyltransferase domain-containing protein [Rhodospirillaceae bacterium]MDG2481443.1 methyltransferase domain-containing protein [Alphaproteobacteria bacterium]
MTFKHVWSDRWSDPRVIFDGLSDDYDRYRPRYAQASLNRMFARTGPVNTILDLGCGTGILTRALKPMVPQALVIGADPGSDMLDQAAVVDGGGGIDWLNCRAEELAVGENSLCLMTAAQAAHWFDRPAFYEECVRTLRPGGTLAILYNNRVRGEPVAEAHERLLETITPGYTREYRDFDVAMELSCINEASAVLVDREVWNWDLTFEEFIGYVRSTSHYKVACKERSETEVITAYADALGPLAQEDGTLRVPYETVVTSARFG